MSLEELALLAEIISGVAVVVSLIYLIVEVRRNTAATRSTAQYTQIGAMVDWNLSLVHVPELSDLIAKANEDYTSVTGAERLKLQGYYANLFNLWHAAYWNWKNGLLDDRGFRVWNVGTPMAFRSQVACFEAWDSMKHIYDEEFIRYVQSILEAERRPNARTPVTWAKETRESET